MPSLIYFPLCHLIIFVTFFPIVLGHGKHIPLYTILSWPHEILIQQLFKKFLCYHLLCNMQVLHCTYRLTIEKKGLSASTWFHGCRKLKVINFTNFLLILFPDNIFLSSFFTFPQGTAFIKLAEYFIILYFFVFFSNTSNNAIQGGMTSFLPTSINLCV